MEMKKERNTNLASLTKEKVKKYLKKHSNKKFNKYYEHIPHIINRLNGLVKNNDTSYGRRAKNHVSTNSMPI